MVATNSSRTGIARARYGREPTDVTVDDHENERVYLGYSLLKHENAIQGEASIIRTTDEPGESEVVSEFENGRIPNGYYEFVRRSLVEQCKRTAEYYEDDPDT
ncbi:hypothetical protein ACFPYI_14870 [Halomarina salina]|uniref:Uncharacterized protein n=1 Tax=Halomarina salina TaxID=1872699 RepID=A0ABD5RQ51_9EURY